MSDRKYFLSVFGKGNVAAKATHTQVRGSWPEMLELFSSHTVNPVEFSQTDSKSKNHALHLHSFIALDVDGALSLKDALERLRALPYGFILGTTRNHQKVKTTRGGQIKEACDRFRIIFPLLNPMTELDWIRSIFQLNDLFDNALDADVSFVHPFFPISIVESREPRDDAAFFKAPDIDDVSSITPTDWSRYSMGGIRPGIPPKGRGSRALGYLARSTRDFLEGRAWKHGGSGWHGLFIRACGDLRDQGYTEAEAEGLLRRVTGSLDQEDLGQLKDMYKRPRLCAMRLNSAWHRGGGMIAGAVGDTKSAVEHSPSFKRDKAQKVPDYVLADTVNRFMSGEFLQAVMSSETLYYEVKDATERQVELVTNEQRLERKFAEKVSLAENQEHQDSRTGEIYERALTVEQAFKLWSRFGPTLDKLPEPFGFRGDSEWVLKRLHFDLSQAGPFPAWEEFLGRLSDAGLFMAWVYSIFDRANRGRQALWLYGPHGRDGKTRVINALADVLGGAAAGIQGTSLKNTQFFLSQLFGKRLVTYSDCKLPHFVKEEIFRNLTGGDRVSIEFKGKTPFSAELYTKLMIASNQRPATSYEGADLSRLIVIEVSPSKIKDDADWVERLKAEMPFFLNACHREYSAKLFRDGKWKHDFVLGGRSAEILERSKDQASGMLSHWFDKFEVDMSREKDWLTQSRLFGLCVAVSGGEPRMTEYQFMEFTKFLEKTKGVELVKRGDSLYYSGLCLKNQVNF